MSIALLILSIICFAASVAFIFIRELIAPVTSFLGLLFMWLSNMLPLNGTIIIMWLCMTVLVTCLPLMQDAAVRNRRDGIGYMTAGGFVGMVIGLLGFTFATTPSMFYGIMIVATAAGIFFGYLMYSNTPRGKSSNIAFSNSFGYLLSKGFPIAVTIMQIGVVFVLLLLVSNPQAAVLQ